MTTTTLVFTGAPQQYIVPAGVSYVTLDVRGAAGCGTIPSKGGRSVGKLIASPGTVLWVYVGGTTVTLLGGWNGGGAGAAGSSWDGGGGGGASDVRVGGQALSNRVIVAGGGGGRGGGGAPGGGGGFGGGAVGGTGGDGTGGGFGNSGGTLTTGYALGQGAPAVYGGLFGGGGGGGGHWGGRGATGSAVAGGGGGGGSGFLSSAIVTPRAYNNVQVGAGQVLITAVNAAPLVPTMEAPPNNGSIIVSEANTFSWTFNDADIGDAQTRADFQYKRVPGDPWTTILNAASTVPSYTLPALTWTAGFQYEWSVSTFDKASAQSYWTASRFINTITAVPAPTITTPAPASDQLFTPVSLAWTLPAGFTQDGYRVQRNSAADGTGTMYYDSGQVVSTSQSAPVSLDASTGRTDYLRVQFMYADKWSLWASVAIVVQFSPPMVPLMVLSQVAGQPAVVVAITNPLGIDGFANTLVTDLYRTSPDGGRVRIAANLLNNSEFTDLLPTAGVNTYTAVAFAASGASTDSY